MELLKQLQTKLAALKATNRVRLYEYALKNLGQDASPKDLADDVVGCAETVTTIMQPIVGNPIILGTATLLEYFQTSGICTKVEKPLPGDIILSATGTGNGSMRGHVGIVGMNNIIMSNDSYTGKFMANYTIPNWINRYNVNGGIPTHYFRLK